MRLTAALTLLTILALGSPAFAAGAYRTVDCRQSTADNLPRSAVLILRGGSCTALVPMPQQAEKPANSVDVLRGSGNQRIVLR